MNLLCKIERIVHTDVTSEWTQASMRRWRSEGIVDCEVLFHHVLRILNCSSEVRPFLRNSKDMFLGQLQCLCTRCSYITYSYSLRIAYLGFFLLRLIYAPHDHGVVLLAGEAEI